MTPQMASDAALGSSLRYPNSAGPAAEPRVALLTGASGFLGRYLLADLVERSSIQEVVCLVRARDDGEARARLLATFPLTRGSTPPEAKKIRVVSADISKPCLGITEGAFSSLASGVDTVFHCAARINLIQSYRLLREPNVIGTHQLLTLASVRPAKTFHHISSAAVLPLGPSDGRAFEAFHVPYSEGLSVGYSQSKWVGEQLVNTAAQNGLSACIYRPSVITGDSRTGASNPFDAASLMLAACIRLRVAPDRGNRFYILPVNYVSQVIIELAFQPASRGRAFHIINRQPVAWSKITTILTDCGAVSGVLPYPDWAELVRKAGSRRSDPVLAQLACILSESPGQGRSPMALVDDSHTRHGIAGRLVPPCAETDEGIIRRYIEWLAGQWVGSQDRESAVSR